MLATAGNKKHQRTSLLLRAAGAGLLSAGAAIHLDLYSIGYRFIPTIGTLFLVQAIVALLLAAAVLLLPRVFVALAGAGFALSTLFGYTLSLWIGLFGFREIRTDAGILAGAIDISTFVVLTSYAAWFAADSVRISNDSSPHDDSKSPSVRLARRLVPVSARLVVPTTALAVLALVLAAANASSSTSTTGEATAPPSGAEGTLIVTIRNFAFVPSHLTAKPGEKIKITNVDAIPHNFVATPNSNPQGSFNSGLINPNATASVAAPTEPGNYSFYCSLHPFMTGVLTVRG